MREQLIRQPERTKLENFVISNYDVYTAASSRLKSNNPNVLARMRNGLVSLMNEYARLPKFIIVIPEGRSTEQHQLHGFWYFISLWQNN